MSNFLKITVKIVDNKLYLLYNHSNNGIRNMYIALNYQSGQPIYEQIEYQIRSQILCGELKAGEMLPSIRMLAKGLQIGIITAKRAYDDLCAEGFLYSVKGKGIFVADVKTDDLTAYKTEKIIGMLKEIKTYAQEHGVDRKLVDELYKQILGE